MIRPYVSLDLETTGLDIEKSHILELGFVYDDGKSTIDQLKKYNFVIHHDRFTHCEPYAMNLNARLIKQIAEKKDTVPFETAINQLLETLREASTAAMKYDEETKAWRIDTRVCIAGKNVAGFDLPLLRNQRATDGLIATLFKYISHRVIDPGSMYYPDFGFIPSLGEINKKNGRNEVTHCAVDDAMDVVCAIRSKFLANA